MRDAVQIERRVLRRRDHRANGNRACVARELVATACAARASHDLGPSQAQQDLLDVVHGQTLAGGDITAGDRPLLSASREVKGADDAVLGQSGDAHGWTLCLSARSYKVDELNRR